MSIVVWRSSLVRGMLLVSSNDPYVATHRLRMKKYERTEKMAMTRKMTAPDQSECQQNDTVCRYAHFRIKYPGTSAIGTARTLHPNSQIQIPMFRTTVATSDISRMVFANARTIPSQTTATASASAQHRRRR